jgi:hypothetical protein
VVPGDHPDDDPAKTFEPLQSPNVPGILPSIASVLVAVVFDRDLHIFPTYIEICDYVAELVTDGDLCLRSRQAEVVPGLVELEVAVPRLVPAVW